MQAMRLKAAYFSSCLRYATHLNYVWLDLHSSCIRNKRALFISPREPTKMISGEILR